MVLGAGDCSRAQVELWQGLSSPSHKCPECLVLVPKGGGCDPQDSGELPGAALAAFCLHHSLVDHPVVVVQLHLCPVLGEILLLSVQKLLGFQIISDKNILKIVQAETVALKLSSVGPCRGTCRFVK